MGVREAAEFLGLTTQRISQLSREHPRFPDPVAELRMGPVWLSEDIEAFSKIPRKKGRPPKGN